MNYFNLFQEICTLNTMERRKVALPEEHTVTGPRKFSLPTTCGMAIVFEAYDLPNPEKFNLSSICENSNKYHLYEKFRKDRMFLLEEHINVPDIRRIIYDSDYASESRLLEFINYIKETRPELTQVIDLLNLKLKADEAPGIPEPYKISISTVSNGYIITIIELKLSRSSDLGMDEIIKAEYPISKADVMGVVKVLSNKHNRSVYVP